MHRIDNATAAVALLTPAAAGTEVSSTAAFREQNAPQEQGDAPVE